MSNFSIKLELSNLKDACLATANGRKCVVIPVDANKGIVIGKKGVYLNLVAIKMKQPSKYGNYTHFVKESLDKEVYQALSDEERNAIPIIGNLKAMGGEDDSDTSATPEAPAITLTPTEDDPDGDLPF